MDKEATYYGSTIFSITISNTVACAILERLELASVVYGGSYWSSHAQANANTFLPWSVRLILTRKVSIMATTPILWASSPGSHS